MFIRKTKKNVQKTQKSYFVYQLVESVRTERGSRQQILLSLGSDIGVADEDLKLLANRIEEIFIGVQSFATCRNRMSARMRVTMCAKTQESKMLYHRSTTRAETPQREIYQALALNSQILKAKKTLV